MPKCFMHMNIHWHCTLNVAMVQLKGIRKGEKSRKKHDMKHAETDICCIWMDLLIYFIALFDLSSYEFKGRFLGPFLGVGFSPVFTAPRNLGWSVAFLGRFWKWPVLNLPKNTTTWNVDYTQYMATSKPQNRKKHDYKIFLCLPTWIIIKLWEGLLRIRNWRSLSWIRLQRYKVVGITYWPWN